MPDINWIRILFVLTAVIFLAFAVQGFVTGKAKTGVEYITFGPYSADAQPVRFMIAQCWNMAAGLFCAYWAFVL